MRTYIVSLSITVYTKPVDGEPGVLEAKKLQRTRPKFLNLMKIRQPLPAVISVLHRISGALLFFPGLPLLLYGLEMTLDSPRGYAQFQSLLTSPLSKGALTLSLWFFLHHLCAGIRFLALDLHYGGALEQARLTSKVTLAAGIILTLLVSLLIW
ncbi:MAG: succinate dehydrogenase, cytochrome b556 subunit [Nitrosospira sp.]